MWIQLSLTAAFMLAAPAFASEPGHADGAAGVSGKPALLDWDIGTAFWSIIVFLILLAVLSLTAWKPILKGLQQREKFILDSIETAKREREAAAKLLVDYQTKLNQAREEATAIVEEGKRDAEAVRKRIHAEARSEGDAMIGRAKKEIEIARDDALKSLYEQAVGLATTMAGRIVRKELTAADHRTLIDESLAEMGRMSG